jgi:membrane protein YdbS with pleckstrin-like domain
LSRDSAFCNRCGTKVQRADEDERSRGARPTVPRPARRRIVSQAKPTARPVFPAEQEYEREPAYDEEDEYEADYDDEADYRDDEEEEEVIFQITPAFYNVALAYLAALLLSVGAAAGAAYVRLPITTALIFSAVFFIYPIWLHIQNRRIVYTLTSIKVEIEEGIFSQNTRNIPLRHIQDVTISETFKERLIGIGDVIIDSASVAGKITMTNINDPRKYADLILNELQYWR